ncbi:DUF1127 domain-containing protein [Ensifer sp. MJa1]|uniref:DUF1127 domain-containing protein n=1 Tax=Ensifer sp. MJa1 TaxID=2919888 RepID=UPI00300BD676
MSKLLSGMSEFYHAVSDDVEHTAEPGEGRVSRWFHPRRLFAMWDDRQHYRDQLAHMATDAPELIDDIGLTEKQVDKEVHKHFWEH